MVNETVVYRSSMGTYLFSGNSVYRRDPRAEGGIPRANPAMFCLIDLDFNKDPSVINFMTARRGQHLSCFGLLSKSIAL
jgi:hypothetical protein